MSRRAIARDIRDFLRDIPFGGVSNPYRVPSLDAMAVTAARILGTTRDAVKKRAGVRLVTSGWWPAQDDEGRDDDRDEGGEG